MLFALPGPPAQCATGTLHAPNGKRCAPVSAREPLSVEGTNALFTGRSSSAAALGCLWVICATEDL